MEDRIKRLELISERLLRRSRKVSTAILTPYPISNASIGDAVKGVILRYMFPCSGKVTKGAIDLGKKPRQDVTITISISNESGGGSRAFTFTKRRTIVEPNIDIVALDRLEVSVDYNEEKPENALTECWVSLLWIPTVKDVEVKNFLIEELENDISEAKEAVRKQLSSGDGGGE